jgi:hypothetical protein
MGRVFLLITIVTAAWAQDREELPLGIVRGKLSEPESTGLRGRFLLTAETGRQTRCNFDERTWFESQRVRVSVNSFGPADPVEVLVDQRLQADGSRRCYARTVRLIEPNAPAPNPRRPVYRSVTEHIIPRGDLTFSGVVTGFTTDSVLVKTRSAPARPLLLRPDMRFLEGGVASHRENLPVNQMVFIRAGKNLEGRLEVYQVIWGEITPGR